MNSPSSSLDLSSFSERQPGCLIINGAQLSFQICSAFFASSGTTLTKINLTIGMINSSVLFDSTKNNSHAMTHALSAYYCTRHARALSLDFLRCLRSVVAQKIMAASVPFK
jgi:hypothetical protein